MKEIILQAMRNCALKHTRGIERYANLWGEQKTYAQMSEDMAKDLEENGYLIIKYDDLKPLTDENGE